jgi:predicted ABC-type ATPase
MVVVAGPPGSGKSTLLRPDEQSLAYFNADERARELNQGSGHRISPEIRAIVNQELESFIVSHIQERRSFAYETTLRTTITYEQARLAKAHGFQTSMEYVALASVEESINRVRKRAERGGHSAPPERVREIYEASLKNFPRALAEFDYVAVFDNTDIENRRQPALILETLNGRMLTLALHVPEWVESTLRGTTYELTEQLKAQVRTRFHGGRSLQSPLRYPE